MRIDQKEIQAVEHLRKFGELKKVSILLNLFSLEGENIHLSQIKKIKGVSSVEEDFKGDLLLV